MRPSRPHDAEIDRDDAAGLVDEEISLMHVGVEKSVAQRMPEKGLDERPRKRPRIEPERGQTVGVGERHALDPFHRHHFARRAVPVDRRRPDFRIIPGILGEFRGGSRLQPKIHFHAHRARQRLDDLNQTQAAHFRRQPLRQPRGEKHVRQIAGEAPFDACAQHLYRDGFVPSLVLTVAR